MYRWLSSLFAVLFLVATDLDTSEPSKPVVDCASRNARAEFVPREVLLASSSGFQQLELKPPPSRDFSATIHNNFTVNRDAERTQDRGICRSPPQGPTSDNEQQNTGNRESTETATRILDVSDLRAMPRGRGILLYSGTPAILLRTIPWMKGPHAGSVSLTVFPAVFISRFPRPASGLGR